MTRFTLTVLPDGRALLTTKERLTDKQAFELRSTLDGWVAHRWPVVVIPECEVVQVHELDVDLDHVVEAVG